MAMTASQAQMANDLEIEMMQDLYMKKCVPPKYKDSELSKGESICLDRCVAKYFEVFDRIGKKLTSITQQQAQAAGQAPQENVLKL